MINYKNDLLDTPSSLGFPISPYKMKGKGKDEVEVAQDVACCSNYTNMHVHGLHVSGKGNSDNRNGGRKHFHPNDRNRALASETPATPAAPPAP